MIRGLGVDLAHASRFERILSRHGERFMQRCLSADEAEQCRASVTPLRFMASRWAAKEALVKAVGRKLPFAGVEVESQGGPPRFRALSEGWRFALSDCTAMLSISHDLDAAVAVVVLTKN